jgi:hypothetical protein
VLAQGTAMWSVTSLPGLQVWKADPGGSPDLRRSVFAWRLGQMREKFFACLLGRS